MRSLWVSLLFLMVSPTYGFSWTIAEVATFPGSLQVSVDPRAAGQTGQLDVLFVVDNSGSMTLHQKNLVANIDALVAPLLAAQLDVHAGVITTAGDRALGQTPGKLVNGFVTSQTPDMAKVLAQNLQVGVSGSGHEVMFGPVIAALSESLNPKFHRPGAALAVVFVTDADDQGALSPTQFIEALSDLKRGNSGLIRLGAMYVPSDDTTSCPRDDGKPVRLEEVLNVFNATKINLCDPDLAKKIGELGNALVTSLPAGEMRLITLPMSAATSTIVVTYGKEKLVGGDLSKGWTYEDQTKALRIGPNFDFNTEPAGTKLLINYTPSDWL